ncbi:MAG: hypothetical protein JWN70_2886 [Planctomycetaceae bacterium]|nr:hypothetical protein [Planctomycetaceae bacterium]
MAAILPLLFSVAFAVISSQALAKGDEPLQYRVGCGFGFGSLVFGGFGLYALLGWITNRRIQVEINADGIVNGTRFWRWDEVNSFTGILYYNGVCIQFNSGWRTVQAPTTPLLTEQQYIGLAQELRRILVRFPNTELAMHPLKSSNS